MGAQVTAFALVRGSGAGTFTGAIKPSLAEQVATDPSAFYVNLHSMRHPNGFMRGDLRLGP